MKDLFMKVFYVDISNGKHGCWARMPRTTLPSI
jgi:hypothetical protein